MVPISVGSEIKKMGNAFKNENLKRRKRGVKEGNGQQIVINYNGASQPLTRTIFEDN